MTSYESPYPEQVITTSRELDYNLQPQFTPVATLAMRSIKNLLNAYHNRQPQVSFESPAEVVYE